MDDIGPIINAETISRAERLLKIVVGDGMDVQGQMEHYQVDRQSYENFHQEMMSLFIRRTQQSHMQYPRTLIPIINTLMVHHFLVGVACGRMTFRDEADAGPNKAQRDEKRKHPKVT